VAVLVAEVLAPLALARAAAAELELAAEVAALLALAAAVEEVAVVVLPARAARLVFLRPVLARVPRRCRRALRLPC
jgi:hypothetical protein